MSKKKTADKVLCVNNICNRKIRLLTICMRQILNFIEKYKYIHNHEMQKKKKKGFLGH